MGALKWVYGGSDREGEPYMAMQSLGPGVIIRKDIDTSHWKLARMWFVFAIMVLLVMVAFTACGGSTSSAQSKEAEVSTCLRKYGIVSSIAGPDEVPLGMTPPRLVVALKKCGARDGKISGSLEAGVTYAAKRAIVERELRKISACLREHGFAVATPRAVYEGPIFYPDGIDTRSGQFRRVERGCRRKVVETVRKLGIGYAYGYGGKLASTTMSNSASRSNAMELAACVRRYGATVIQAGTQVGLSVLGHMSSTELATILKNCHVGSTSVDRGP